MFAEGHLVLDRERVSPGSRVPLPYGNRQLDLGGFRCSLYATAPGGNQPGQVGGYLGTIGRWGPKPGRHFTTSWEAGIGSSQDLVATSLSEVIMSIPRHPFQLYQPGPGRSLERQSISPALRPMEVPFGTVARSAGLRGRPPPGATVEIQPAHWETGVQGSTILVS